MSLEFWAAVIAQLGALLTVALRLEHRLTRLESDMRWLIRRQHQNPGENHESH